MPRRGPRISIETDEFGEEMSSPGEQFPEHPLFPLEKEGDHQPDISFIQVTRRQDGAMVWGPVIPAAELTSLDQIIERWGGGYYELQGRKRSKHFPGQPGNFARKRTVTLPGREKPFSDSPTLKERVAAGLEGGSSSSTATALPVVPTGLGMGDTVLVAILNMQQQAAQQSSQMMLNFMTMFMKMIEDGKASAQQQQAATMQMISTMSTSQQQSMMTLLPLLIQNRGGGPEEVAKYAELFKALGGGGGSSIETEKEEPGIGSMLENLADIVAGAPAAVSALQGLKPPPPLGPGDPVPPNGSAASVLMPR
jgi:hypothetical protein